MAKQAKAPTEAGEGEVAPKKGKKKLVMIAAAVLVLGGGAGGYMLMGKKADAHGAPAEAAHEKTPVAFVDVQEMVVNLAPETAGDKSRFLKLKVALELKDGKAAGDVQPLMPRVVDLFQVYVRELRASDLEGSGGIYRLREELLRRVNVAVYPAKVEAVLFREVIVQ